MTAALEGGEWSAARPGRTLSPGKTRYPLYRRLGGSQGRSGRAENLVPTGIWSQTVQPVVIRYTDWATRPTEQTWKANKIKDDKIGEAERKHRKMRGCFLLMTENWEDLLRYVIKYFWASYLLTISVKDVIYRRRKKRTGENRNALINTVSVILVWC